MLGQKLKLTFTTFFNPVFIVMWCGNRSFHACVAQRPYLFPGFDAAGWDLGRLLPDLLTSSLLIWHI